MQLRRKRSGEVILWMCWVTDSGEGGNARADSLWVCKRWIVIHRLLF